MKQIRDTQRSRRLLSDVASIAIVGYTNAGKSSVLNTLTGAGVLVQNVVRHPRTHNATWRNSRTAGRSC